MVKKKSAKKKVSKTATKKSVKKKVAKKVTKKPAVKKATSKTAKKPSMSAFLDSWVKNHPSGWDHQAWLDLLTDLSANNYAYTPEKIGTHIEKQRRKYFGW